MKPYEGQETQLAKQELTAPGQGSLECEMGGRTSQEDKPTTGAVM